MARFLLLFDIKRKLEPTFIHKIKKDDTIERRKKWVNR